MQDELERDLEREVVRQLHEENLRLKQKLQEMEDKERWLEREMGMLKRVMERETSLQRKLRSDYWCQEVRREDQPLGRAHGRLEGNRASGQHGHHEGDRAFRQQGLSEGDRAVQQHGHHEGDRAFRQQGLPEGDRAVKQHGVREGDQAAGTT